MDRMKTLFKYFMAIVILVVLTNVVSYFLLQSNYNDVSYTSNIQNPTVTIEESKATNVNGYVKGRIKNDTEEDIINKYLRLDFFTKRGVNVGTNYVKIDKIEPRSFQDFNSSFKLDKVSDVKMTLVDASEIENNKKEKTKLFDFGNIFGNSNGENKEWTNDQKFYVIVGLAVALWAFGF